MTYQIGRSHRPCDPFKEFASELVLALCSDPTIPSLLHPGRIRIDA